MWMKMKHLNARPFLLTALLILVYGGCGGGGGQEPSQRPDPAPPVSDPSACAVPPLDSSFSDGAQTRSYVFSTETTGLTVRAYSDSSNVYLIASDGFTTFGFKGVPVNGGDSCELFAAMADYDGDGIFDETAGNFTSTCTRLDDGAMLTFLDGPGSVDASHIFEHGLLVLFNQALLFNILMPVSCLGVEDIAGNAELEPVFAQLMAL